ncbi:disulfide bond formation protein B [Rubrivivax albus]|uniref:Disulfide bond formation protein B n=1 Tax=Rubrivivax albus TaxID=2499835 RepID=A0A3S2U1P4_9BURK|nr:disulfide bond formation protein B [Rubrivivax albus]RVT50143.1 disulfide bond formation protein B [Rubrivivax albus]
MTPSRKRGVLVLTALAALAAVGAAYFTQHVWGMQPCPWCVLQRLIFVAVAAAAVLGLLWPTGGAVLAGLLAASGLAAALWQHFVAASAESCDLTLADRIMAATGLDGQFPEVFMAMSSCADAKVDLFGLPYEAWSGALFAATLVAMAAMLRRR